MIPPGCTYRLVAPDGDRHLWMVISDATPQMRVAIANLTTRRDPCDLSCLLDRGDHPAITHPTIVNYAKAYLTDVELLEEKFARGRFAEGPALSPPVLRRVQEGALVSEFTKGVVQDAVRASLGHLGIG